MQEDLFPLYILIHFVLLLQRVEHHQKKEEGEYNIKCTQQRFRMMQHIKRDTYTF